MFNNRAVRVALYVWAGSLTVLVTLAIVARVMGW